MSPIEAIGFSKCVMTCFDNKEFRENWERLRRLRLNHNKKTMTRFIKDVRDLVWDRLPAQAKYEIAVDRP